DATDRPAILLPLFQIPNLSEFPAFVRATVCARTWRSVMSKFFMSVAVLVCLMKPTHTFAQTSNATLGGTISDASGALIPGVTITATNSQTGIVNSVVSNESGAYQFASLQTGTYKVSAELPGFRTQTYGDVALGVSQQVRLNFTLQVGSIAQE